jgi:hypothetical protein
VGPAEPLSAAVPTTVEVPVGTVGRSIAPMGAYATPSGPVDLDALRGGWVPQRVLGAASGMSLALPAADPTRGQLYAPRGVLLDPLPDGSVRLVAADTGNHRLLVWPSLPAVDGADCAVVVGQPSATAEGPQAGGRGPERGLHLPTGLARYGDVLLVADGWNHRVLAFDAALDADDPAPVHVLGQASLSDVEPNRGGEPTGASFYWPFGLLLHEGWLWVADTGNRRVLGWQGVPGLDGTPSDRPADVVLGQPSATVRGENRDGPVGAGTFRWPHQLVVHDGVLWIADAGNHRVLGWVLPLPADRPADLVLGQGGFETARELPHVPQGPHRLRFPYGLAVTASGIVVGDTANNRVLAWTPPPGPGGVVGGAAADVVLGQDSFDGAGENRWTAVTDDSFCWPYGLSAAADPRGGDLLAVADSGNNRVTVWRRP